MALSWLWQTTSEVFPPTTRFTADQIPDLQGKVIIVTGGYTGIGKECCKHLLAKNAKVYILGRSKSKADAAIEELKKEVGKDELHFIEVDLSDLPSVRKAAEEFKSHEKHLHVLMNNAGVMVPPLEMVTAQGYDLQFGTNVLGHYLFTNLLLPMIESTAKETGHPGRVVEVSSIMHVLSGDPIIHFETLKDGPARKRMRADALYSQSKSGNILVTKARARANKDKPILFITLNPGGIRTELLRHAPSNLIWNWVRMFLKPVSFGALTQLWAATMPEAEKYNGAFLIPWARVGTPRPNHENEELQDQLVHWLEGEIKPYL